MFMWEYSCRGGFPVPNIQLNEIGKIINEYIHIIPLKYNTIKIDKYIIMPNHIHLIVVIIDTNPLKWELDCYHAKWSRLVQLNQNKNYTQNNVNQTLLSVEVFCALVAIMAWSKSYLDLSFVNFRIFGTFIRVLK